MNMNKPVVSRRTLLKSTASAAIAVTAVGATESARAATGTPTSDGAAGQLVVYPIPAGMAVNASFTIQVRTGSLGRWQPVSAYLATLNLINTTTGGGQIQNSSMAYFDFTGTVEASVTYTKGPIKSARIRPDSYGIEPTVHGDTLNFTLTEPRNVVVQVNDDIFDCLHLLTNTIETAPPSPGDPNVIYFGPGVHTTATGTVVVPSGGTVYLAGGAVLTSRVVFSNVDNAKLVGRGIIYAAPGGGATVEYSSAITIDGVIMLDPNGYAVTAGQATNLTIRNLKAFSSKGNGDGIDLFCCQNALIDGVFIRNSDDCIAIYNHRWNYYGDSGDITVQNCVLWADAAHPINIGTHGNTANPETLSNLTFSNIDILDHREPQMLYQGCITINVGDSNLLSGARFENIRVEDFRQGQLVNMRVMYNTMYNTSPGRGIQNVYIKNLSYTGTHANPSILVGYDDSRPISGITFENLIVNGALIADTMKKPSWYLTSDFVPMYANEHVTNLTFIAPTRS